MPISLDNARMQVINLLLDHIGLAAQPYIDVLDRINDKRVLDAEVFKMLTQFDDHTNAALSALLEQIKG